MTNVRLPLLIATTQIVSSTQAFQLPSLPQTHIPFLTKPPNTISPQSPYLPTTSTTVSIPTTTTTQLHGKAWEKLGIEEDLPTDPPVWYLLNCVVGTELALLAQAKHATRDLPPSVISKLAVPTNRHLRSHGKRNVVDIRVAYPGYVFCKMRLTVDSYETLQALPLMRSWMAGTVNQKGYKKLPPAPIALSDDEVEKFRGLEEESEAMYLKYGEDYDGRGDSGEDLLDQYQDYQVEDMVKVLSGNFEGEDGAVRRLKDGKIMVRLYTYGTALDQWFRPEELRKMTTLEAAKGLTGGQAIDQNTFDVSIGKKPERVEDRDERGRGRNSVRSGLMAGVGGGGGSRQTRQDRTARGERGNTDIYGRTRKEAQKEEDNWRKFRENQREEQRRKTKVGDSWGMKENNSWSDADKEDVADALDGEGGWDALTDALSSSSSSAAGGGGGGTVKESLPEDDFFNSLMAELSADLGSSGGGSGGRGGDGSSNDTSNRGKSAVDMEEEDDFFSSLMSDLSESMDDVAPLSPPPSPKQQQQQQQPKESEKTTTASVDEDDFFASLESDLRQTLNDGDGSTKSSTTADEDDFFASLEKDLSDDNDDDEGPSSQKVKRAKINDGPAPTKNDDNGLDIDDDFFASLVSDLNEVDEGPSSQKIKRAKINESPSPTKNDDNGLDVDDDFFASLVSDLNEALVGVDEGDGFAADGKLAEDDFFAALESELGDMLDINENDVEDVAESTESMVDPVVSATDSDVGGHSGGSSSGGGGGVEGGDEDYSKLTVVKLKAILKERGLKVSGKKSELIERLRQ